MVFFAVELRHEAGSEKVMDSLGGRAQASFMAWKVRVKRVHSKGSDKVFVHLSSLLPAVWNWAALVALGAAWVFGGLSSWGPWVAGVFLLPNFLFLPALHRRLMLRALKKKGWKGSYSVLSADEAIAALMEV